jgi:3-oxoacyl-(acyl-carrier-protein) synthase
VLAPNGHGLDAFEAALREGRSGIRFVERLRELKFGCQVAGVPEDVEAIKERYFSEEIRMSLKASAVSYGCIAALDAWRDAGLVVPAQGENTIDWDAGAIMGTGIGGIDMVCETVVPMINAGKARRMGSTIVEQVMVSGVSARISGLLGLGGQVTTNSSACTTGTEAIVQAFHQIREGRAERMLAGGSEGSSPYTWGSFDAMRVLCANQNETPEKASRPMSASAAGFVPGSGAGALVLESLDSALKRGARIYAEILGGHINSGGHRGGGSMTAPNPEGVRRCIRESLYQAKIDPKDIDVINGHLTATFADPMELKNWHSALEIPYEDFPWINSTKSMIGHALGAAGAIESVAGLLQLHKGFVHGSINCEDLHPELEPFRGSIPQRTIQSDAKILAKASFGFGDVNGCAIFKKWEDRS